MGCSNLPFVFKPFCFRAALHDKTGTRISTATAIAAAKSVSSLVLKIMTKLSPRQCQKNVLFTSKIAVFALLSHSQETSKFLPRLRNGLVYLYSGFELSIRCLEEFFGTYEENIHTGDCICF